MPEMKIRDGTKWCPQCKAWLPFESFAKHKGAPHGMYGTCKPCKRAYSKALQERIGERDPRELADRFWKYVNRTEGCWLWTGSIKKQDGYGVFWLGGKLKRVHRIAWVLNGGTLPEWPMVLDHICKVRHCCKPEHLRIVHQNDNTGILADRSKVGERIKATKAANRARRESP